jgi:steroid 5-alpha reductase family enzyme
VAHRARNQGKREDPRYVEIIERAKGNPVAHLVRKVYVPQAVIMWVVSLAGPARAVRVRGGRARHRRHGARRAVVGGRVLLRDGRRRPARRVQGRPANKGKVMDRGLWRYTRHPNYFGDAAIWWGLTLLALHHAAGLIGLVSAALMTWLLAKGTGAALLERSIGKRRPGYAEYVRRTSGFIPLPPKKTVS